MKWFAAFVLPLALLALVVACEEEEEEATIITPSPAAMVTATPQATPTAEPTPAPTLEPTPTPALSDGDESENLATRVYRYKPRFPDDVLPLDEANYCWTASIASNRSDAFRCVLGNLIHDPCFSTGISIGDDIMPVVCPGDPRTPSDDIAFTFDVSTVPVDPYRGPARVKSGDNVWFMVVNGQGCYALTGTLPSVGRKYYEFSCFDIYCTKPVQGVQGFVSDCWNPDTGEEKSVTLDAVWY